MQVSPVPAHYMLLRDNSLVAFTALIIAEIDSAATHHSEKRDTRHPSHSKLHTRAMHLLTHSPALTAHS